MSNAMSHLASHVRAEGGRTPESASEREFWAGLSRVVMDRLAEDWERTTRAYEAKRRQHYFSAEFLMGRALANNLLNLGLYDEAQETVAALGHNLSDVLEAEPDAALGNGGLGRLAACFLDSCATQNLPATGYGILYRYGLFKQTFEEGFQTEHPDPWMEEGYPFVVRREHEAREVHFDDLVVRAVPHDMPITGYGTNNVNTLRLWNAEPMREFDYEAFNSQRFTDAIIERERVHDLCRVLYPNDSTYDGKILRIRQQYFFVSAALQEMVDKHLHIHGNLKKFAEYNCIQLNDTHPVLAIPELMRLLLDDHHLSWDEAWNITIRTFAYTNHTVLAEALETWEYSIFERLFGRILDIIKEIDRRFREDMVSRGKSQDEIEYLAPISHGHIHMAWIACYAAYSINGVAHLHTEILKRDTLKRWYELWPEKFNNKTNGVTPRRWLHQCNPRLSALLTRLSGSDEWVTNLPTLSQLEVYANDENVLRELSAIKRANKKDFARWLKDRQGLEINPEAIFDVQIKRLHEYKRQLLNAFYVLDLYYRIKNNPQWDVPPRVVIFGAKAAPGYVRAKTIIKFINSIADLVNGDSDVAGKLAVVFVENYNVSPAERIIPAADISEQISTAGKEASGTSNMKFMMNGALTLGTLDGANMEIAEAVGPTHAYIFGATEEELPALRKNYDPRAAYASVPGLQRVVDTLSDGTFDDGGTGVFFDLRRSLLEGSAGEPADTWYVLGDFAAYRDTRDAMAENYRDEQSWAHSCFLNIVRSGRFSSDRTIADYACEVWRIDATPI